MAVNANLKGKPDIIEVAISANVNAKPLGQTHNMFETVTARGHHFKVYGMDNPDSDFFEDMELITIHCLKVRQLTMPKHIIICLRSLNKPRPLAGRSMMFAYYAALMDMKANYLYSGSLMVGCDIYAQGQMNLDTILAKAAAVNGQYVKLVIATRNAAELLNATKGTLGTAFDLNPTIVVCTTPLIFTGLKQYMTSKEENIIPASETRLEK